jgi:phosphoglycolate phosphatase-like HAD superfamily hydrolase
VIFDLDGTLVDSYEALLEAVNAALSLHGDTGSADFDELDAAAPDYMLAQFSDLVDIVQNGGVDG